MKKDKDELNFPIFKGDLPAARPLTMDEYLAFVQFNLKHIRVPRDPNAGRYKYDFKVRFKL